MPEYPQFLSLKNLIAKRMTMQRFMPSEAIRGKEVIDVTKWMPPVISESFVFMLANKPHLLPYLVGGKRLSGWLGDIWEGIKSVGENVWSFVKDNKWLVIPAAAGATAFAVSEDVREHPEYVLGPLGTYALGYALYKWSSNPNQAVKEGIDEFYKYGYEGIPQPEEEYYKYGYEAPPTIPKEPAPKSLQTAVASSPILKDLVKVGSDVAAAFILKEIQENAVKQGQTSKQTVEQGQAYVTRWMPELAKMGFQSPEQALAAILYATKGLPPDPNKNPYELLQIRPMVEAKEGTVEAFLKKYWWALGIGALVIMSRGKTEETHVS